MSMKILIVPDKFKGTLAAHGVAEAIASGRKQSRPKDQLTLLPMSDGGEGFGEVLEEILGAKPQSIKTVNAAHEPITATWWWEPKSKTAIIESARIIGLAMLPPKKFHPYQLDTFGLGKVIEAAAKRSARKCLIGIGGSATNDAGFGMARALGWKFTDKAGEEIVNWADHRLLGKIIPPRKRKFFPKLIIAVDVQNPLNGPRGCSAVYGPQKGLTKNDIKPADKKLSRMAQVAREQLALDFAKVPGAGAAGGLGYGLMTYLGGKPQSGFEIFAQHSGLEEKIAQSDLVISGEGALDQQTFMGKGVGQIAMLCKKLKVPCIGLAGVVLDAERGKRLFKSMHGLVEITSVENAKKFPAKYLKQLAAQVADTSFE